MGVTVLWETAFGGTLRFRVQGFGVCIDLELQCLGFRLLRGQDDIRLGHRPRKYYSGLMLGMITLFADRSCDREVCT